MLSTLTDSLISLDLIESLIKFDTTSRESNLELIAFVQDYLGNLGVDCQLIHNDDKQKANLYATLGPKDKSGVMLSGHTDVVPVDGQAWATDPFSVKRGDGKLFGRGTSDMKSFIAIVLAYAPEILRRNLSTPIHLAFSYDEEIGCIGAHGLVDMLKGAPVKPAMCIVGEPTSMKVMIAHKGKLSYRATVRGFECHSSLAPTSVNAVEYAAEAITYLKNMARRFAAEGPFDDDFDIRHTTVHTGVIHGGAALNIVPKDCTFDFEFRHLPSVDGAALFEEFRKYVTTTLEPEMQALIPNTGFDFHPLSLIPGLDSRADEDVVTFVKSIAEQNEHGKVAFGTEAGLFQKQAGIPTVICGPGNIEQAHKPDEFVTLEQIALCEKFMQRLIERLADGPV
jgi:acetylornithine deacetylase